MDLAAAIDEELDIAETLGTLPAAGVKIQLSEYVRKIKGFKLDPWQVDLCDRLEKIFWLAQSSKFTFIDLGTGNIITPSGLHIPYDEFYEKKNKGTRVAIHAFPQGGKSFIVSQCYPAWILGYDPIHRFRLATYSMTQSRAFSEVILLILRSPEHQAIFTDPAGYPEPRGNTYKWFTIARRQVADSQSSFTGLGLKSGFVGTGADTLLMDDPYKSAEEALSDVIRDKTWRFFTDTAEPRLNEQSNAIIMFHRYHQDDIGGRALATGDFTLWRYAAEADGEYEDDEGRKYPCLPLDREEGEYLSPRFSAEWYQKKKRNEQVWLSQFQGVPTSKTGTFFNITKLIETPSHLVPRILYSVRAWDNAATEGGGAFSAGVFMGIDATEHVYVFHVVREQVGTAERKALQFRTAKRDGKLVPIHGPQDPGSAGVDVAFEFRQTFSQEGYNVQTTPVSGSKEMRALNYSSAVNEGRGHLVIQMVKVSDSPLRYEPAPAEAQWDLSEYKKELKNFPTGTYKDQVDASADAYNYLMKLFYRGLVIKSATAENLLPWTVFSKRFGNKIPKDCEVGVALRFEADSSKPSGWAIVARASDNMQIGETVFLVASGRRFVTQATDLLQDLTRALKRFCEGGIEHPQVVWLGGKSADISQVALEKFNFVIQPFTEEASAGVAETNWYFLDEHRASHFYPEPARAMRCYMLCADGQIDSPTNDDGLLSSRQELPSWGYNEQGEPQAYSGITLDCMRMILYNFALTATGMTREQKRIAALPEELKPAVILEKIGQPEFVELYTAQQHAMNQIKIREEKEDAEFQQQLDRLLPRPTQHRRYRTRA